MTTKIIIGSLALDLTRVAIGYHQGSVRMAEVFSQEAVKRKNEIESTEVKPYIKILLSNLEIMLSQKNKEQVAEDALMYSILFQNYAQQL